jgi:uncharacterized protein YbjT (DUF2867 family)
VSGRPEALLLDEMFSPRIAEELARRGHDVVALVADPELRALTDPEVYAIAGERGRRVVTENVRDFRVLLSDGSGAGVLFTSNRTFPRSRRNLGPLIEAIEHWIAASAESERPTEDWLLPPSGKPAGVAD